MKIKIKKVGIWVSGFLSLGMVYPIPKFIYEFFVFWNHTHPITRSNSYFWVFWMDL